MKSPSTTQSLLALAGFVAATMSAASSGAKFSRNRSRLWYRTLNKPAFTPPDKSFPNRLDHTLRPHGVVGMAGLAFASLGAA